MNHDLNEINRQRILQLMGSIEDRTGKCFHEIDEDLEKHCINAIDGRAKASFVINQLTKMLDEIESQ